MILLDKGMTKILAFYEILLLNEYEYYTNIFI